MASLKRRLSQKGVSLMVGAASMVLLIPSAGLAVDCAMLYYTKARIQGAVDGASLAAARALTLGATTAAQAAAAQQNAVNWFYANFPSTLWGTSNTQMDQSTVDVRDDPNNPSLRNVTVTANTTVPTIFMKWFNVPPTLVAAVGKASRRDVVAMLIIDRSGSMNNGSPVACGAMRTAAKLFTGQFAAGRDQIGMVEFGDTAWIDSPPTTNFQTVLGYKAANGASANGFIDTISCGDNTGTAQAISLAYNELYRINLPGAFNFLMFFTDGIPNTVTVDLRSIMVHPGTGSTNLCKDSTGATIATTGNMVLHPPSWTTGWSTAGWYTSVPAGPVGAVGAQDPNNTVTFGVRNYKGTGQGALTGHGTIGSGTAPGCAFPASENNYVNDFQKLPPTDAWGNALTGYNAVPMSGSNILLNGNYNPSPAMTGNNLTFHLVARNAADNAASQARTNATLPVTIFGIGLGGTSQAPPGYDFMQRVTNDPNGDLYNSPALYTACSTEPLCVTHSDQPQGVFIFSSDSTKLQQAFLELASQILRLAR